MICTNWKLTGGKLWSHKLLTVQNRSVEQDISRGVLITGNSLVLQRVSRDQAGDYSCHASNLEGDSTSRVINIQIKCKYQGKLMAHFFIKYQSTFYILTCQILKITFYQDKTKIQNIWSLKIFVLQTVPCVVERAAGWEQISAVMWAYCALCSPLLLLTASAGHSTTASNLSQCRVINSNRMEWGACWFIQWGPSWTTDSFTAGPVTVRGGERPRVSTTSYRPLSPTRPDNAPSTTRTGSIFLFKRLFANSEIT